MTIEKRNELFVIAVLLLVAVLTAFGALMEPVFP